jgi:hypothetical protein
LADGDDTINRRKTSSTGSISKTNLLMAPILIAVLMLDTLLSNISDITSEYLSSIWGVLLFAAITGTAFGSGQLILGRYIKRVSADLRARKRDLDYMYKATSITHYLLMGILVIMIGQMLISSEYYTILMMAATTIGYLLGALIMGILSYRFFLWFKFNKRSMLIPLFGIATALTSFSLIGLIISQDGLLLEANEMEIGPQSIVTFPTVNPESSMGSLLSFAYIITILAYLFAWGSIAFMLRHYSYRLGRIKYWVVISLPLALFLFGLTPILVTLPTTSTYFDPGLLAFRVLAIVALIGNGALFGIAFLTIARSIRNRIHTTIIDYLNMSSLGVAALFITLAANIAQGSFPPFGTVSYSLIGLASYLFTAGIYSSAISVSEDVKLRQTIRRSAMDESKLIDSITSANIEQEIQKKVMLMAKSQHSRMLQESGIRSSLEEDDIKRYIEQVLKEIKHTST